MSKLLGYSTLLLDIKLVAWIALFWRIDHHLDKALSDDWWTELYADELVNLLSYLLVEADELKVTTAMPTLANSAL